MRFLRLVLALTFATAAVVQYNDPDALRWVALYGLASLLCFWSLGAAPPRLLVVGTALWAGIWAAYWVPGVLAQGAITFDEEQRELGGLVIVALVMAGLALRRGVGARAGAAA